MKKLFIYYLLFTFLLSIGIVWAGHKTFVYDFNYFKKYEVKGSKNYYKFKSDLIEDKDVIKQINNSNKSGLISYLLFENDKIKIDESSLPNYVKNNNGALLSNSVGKSLVSYVTGHAICEGYIQNVNVTLSDWNILNGTLYKDSKLIDLLNMKAGDQNIIGEKKYNSDNIISKIKGLELNINTLPLKDVMELNLLQTTKKAKLVYNYSALTTNVIMNYVIYKTRDDWEKLLHKVFNEHVRIKNNVYFLQTVNPNYNETDASGRYSFYADRYDYLRIAKTIMDDWNNNTCVGKYLKTIYNQRVNKNIKPEANKDVGQYTTKYGGQFHFDIVGLKNRKILSMSGYGGQNIIIDFDRNKIITVHSTDRHYNWKKIVYKKLKFEEDE